jgi:hypothetical protein
MPDWRKERLWRLCKGCLEVLALEGISPGGTVDQAKQNWLEILAALGRSVGLTAVDVAIYAQTNRALWPDVPIRPCPLFDNPKDPRKDVASLTRDG